MILILDNNVLFSLMNPHSINSYLFSSIKAAFSAPDFIKSEFEEHREECLIKSKLSEHEFEIRQKDVESKIEFIELSKYKAFLKRAKDILSDPDDAPYLAAALSIKASTWSNDPHLRQQSLVRVFTTSDLVKLFLKGLI